MLHRAVKCACQFNFKIEDTTFQAMKDLSGITEGILKMIVDKTVPGLTEWLLGNIFTPLKYNPALFEKLWDETGLMKVFISFTAKQLGYKTEQNLPNNIFNQNQKYGWEEAINIFLSTVARQLDSADSERAFDRIIELFSIKEEKQYQDFLIDSSKIFYQA